MLSCVILTKNEEKNIRDCIKAVNFCDEIIVVDDYSDDSTVSIAKKLGAKVFLRRLNSDFSVQRNYALKKVKGPWVLFIDADERVSRDLASEIVQMINDPLLSFKGFYLKRTDFIWKKKLSQGEVGGIKLLRLARKDEGVWRRRVHEYWDIERGTRLLKNPLYHHPHPTLHEFIADVNRMSTLHALANKQEGKKGSVIKIIFFPIGHFVKNFIIKRGFLDGLAGFVFALVMALHSYLAWSKLWMLERGYQEI